MHGFAAIACLYIVKTCINDKNMFWDSCLYSRVNLLCFRLPRMVET